MANRLSSNETAADTYRALPNLIALVVGAVYTLVGIAGFLVTGFTDFASSHGDSLFGFEVNPLHNIVHIVIGLAGLAMSRKLGLTRTYGWLLFLGYGAVFVYGLFAVSRDNINFLALNTADNWLHILSALVGLLIALAPAGRTASRQPASARRA
jgi:hypothetical protein